MKIRLDAATTESAARVTIQCPAKVNLFLEVLGKRGDGFHEIETLMCPISLCDELTASLNDCGKINLSVETPNSMRASTPVSNSTTDPSPNSETNACAAASDSATSREMDQRQTADPAWDIPDDSSNLAHRAAQAVQQELFGSLDEQSPKEFKPAVDCPGVDLVLKKSIPASAGLAGGSSNAAAVVTACLLLWAKWNRPVATQICQELGSDVAFFLGSSSQVGMAMATGRGEIIAPLRCKPPLSFVLTHPPQGCSTPAIYAAMGPRESVRNSGNIRTACETSAPGQLKNIGAGLFNALQSPASDRNPWIARQLDLLSSHGFDYNMMSGSGSACFGLCVEPNAEQIADSPSSSLPGLPGFQEAAFRQAAGHLGIERVFGANAWYQASIEVQVGQQRNWNARLLQ